MWRHARRISAFIVVVFLVTSLSWSAETLDIGNKAPEFSQALEQVQPGQIIMDLVRIADDTSQLNGQYNGICW